MKKFHAPVPPRGRKRAAGGGAPGVIRTRSSGGDAPPRAASRRWVPPELGSLVRISGTRGDQQRYIVIACTIPPSGDWGEVTLMGGNGIQTVYAKRILPD